MDGLANNRCYRRLCCKNGPFVGSGRKFNTQQVARWDCPGILGVMPFSQRPVCNGRPVKSMFEPGTTRAVVERAANLEQEIGDTS
jgi:hypothetical protein